MTDKEFLNNIQPLVPIMEEYKKTNTGNLTPSHVQIMKDNYTHLQTLVQIPKTFTASCGSCVKDVFIAYMTVYERLKE